MKYRPLVLLLTALAISPMTVRAERFQFMALGDMPYTLPRDAAAMQRLIARTNQIKPAFSVHVGDIKNGTDPCTDDVYARALALFGEFDQPLVYTPGDNEWTDCHRTGQDPLERLAYLRRVMFAHAGSLGRAPMPLAHESSDPDYAPFVENVRWEKAHVVFATVHIVGDNNDLRGDASAVVEYTQRNAANLAWINAAFDRAEHSGAPALVLFFQADPFLAASGRPSGFKDTLDLIRRRALEYAKPVLLVHGDRHHLLIDQPLLAPDGRRMLNVTRLMVYGDSEVDSVLVTVDTRSPEIFSYTPVVIPEGTLPSVPGP